MKVVHVLSNYLPQHVAGTEVYVAALVKELKKQHVESHIMIPGHGQNTDLTYFFDDTPVTCFAEPFVADRQVIMGEKPPAGLQNFIEAVKSQLPDIVHFHELAGSTGIGLYHVKEVKKAGFKTLMTFHLAKYSCRTGTLMYMNKEKCDGVIREIRCSKCWLNYRGERGLKAAFLTAGFSLFSHLNIDTRKLNNKIGTALAFPLIIKKMKLDLLQLESFTDQFILLTDWYKNILIRNGIKESHCTLLTQGLPSAWSSPLPVKEEGPLRIIFIGRVSAFKGLDILIRAFRRMSPDKIMLHIYGEATEEDYLRLCMKLSTGMENIVWKGRLAPELAIPTIAKYDAICIPSAVSEMGPLVLKEAFAAGVPAVASDVYGNAEQIRHNENGWLFKFKDAGDLAEKLHFLVKNRQELKRAAIHLPAVKKVEEVAAEHIILYKKILSA